MRRTLTFLSPVDVARTLAPLRQGRDDPTIRLLPGGAVLAFRTPDGISTLALESLAADRVEARAWGPGGDWALSHAPTLLGSDDDPSAFAPTHPVVRHLHRRAPGLRVPRSGRVFEALVPAILAQRVTSFEASRSYRQLVVRWGEPAPGPGGLMIAPSPDVLATLPYYELHVVGVEKKRADALRRVGGLSARLDALAAAPLAEARARLGEISGIGTWTVAEVALRALGDADAVSVGDHNLKHQIAWALAGEQQGSDDRMLELLEPFVGHRGRVCRLVVTARIRPPRHASRQAIEPMARR
jgi:3-methyladenine DNA glycosylase/8-oxoguanine DNA glycosylase